MNIKKHFFVFSLLISSFAFGMREQDQDVVLQERRFTVDPLLFGYAGEFRFSSKRYRISPDCKTLALLDRRHISLRAPSASRFIDLTTGEQRMHLSRVRRVEFAPGNKYVAVLFSDTYKEKSLQLYDVETMKKVWARKITGVNSFVFSPNGRTLAVICGQSKKYRHPYDRSQDVYSDLRLIDVEAGEEKWKTSRHKLVGVRFSPKGKYLVVQGPIDARRHDTEYFLLDTKNGRRIDTFVLPSNGGYPYSFSSDAMYAAIYCGAFQELHVFNVKNGRTEGGRGFFILDSVLTCSGARGHEFSPDGSSVAVSFKDDSLQVFDVASKHALWPEKLPDVDNFYFIPKQNDLVVLFRDRSLGVVDAASGGVKWRRKVVDTEDFFPHFDKFSCSTDGTKLAVTIKSADNDSLQLLDAQTGEMIWDRPIDGVFKRYGIFCPFRFSPDSKYIAVERTDKTWCLVNVEAGEIVLKNAAFFHFCTEQKRVVAVFERLIKTYRLPSEEVGSFRKHLLAATTAADAIEEEEGELAFQEDDAVVVGAQPSDRPLAEFGATRRANAPDMHVVCDS